MPSRPMHDRAVARAAPVRGHLLRPLQGRVHRPSPADRVVVVGRGRTELVDLRDHELRGLQRGHAVEVRHLVEGAVEGAFGRGPVVADDVVDQRVLEHSEILDRVDHPSDVMIRVLEESGIHFHLAFEDRLQFGGHVVPRGDLRVTRSQLGVCRNDTEFLLACERALTLRVPPAGELTLVLVGPLLRHVVGRVRGSRSEVHEERLVGHECLLRADPVDRAVGQILGEVVSLLGRRRRLDRRRPVVQRGLPLVVLPADEAIERLETAAHRRPRIERAHGRGLPHRNLVALAELSGGVAVELQGHRQRSLGVRAQRAVARGRRRGLGDAAHSDRVMVPAAQHGRTRRCAQGCRVEPVVLQASRCELLGIRRRARTAEGARCAEAGVVDQDDQDVGGALRRQQGRDRRKCRIGILRVIRRQAWRGPIRDRQHRAGVAIGSHERPPDGDSA